MAEMSSINERLAEITIDDEENEEMVFDVGVEDEVDKFELCLVGRFLTEKNLNSRAMKSKLVDVWRPTRGISIKDLKDGAFLFQFYHVDDMQWVVNGGPWAFDGSMLVTSTIPKGEDPLKVPLYNLSFWIQLHGLPTGFMTEVVGRQHGNFFGSFLAYDPNNNTSIWRESMRIRIQVDVRKPLKRKKKICKRDGSKCIVNCKYERLGDFCFTCGMLTHTDRFCKKNMGGGQEALGEWGGWLRAPPRRAGGQEKSKWLRDEKDGDWGEKFGKDNYYNQSADWQEGMKGKESYFRSWSRGIVISNVTNLGAQSGGENLNVSAGYFKTNGPTEDELVGLKIEERKRRRSGLDTKEYMKTDRSIGDTEISPMEAILSNKYCIVSSSPALAKLAMKIEDIRVKFGFSQCFAVDCIGYSGSLAVLWKNNIACEVTGYSQNHIDVVFLNNSVASWRLSCFYGFPERGRRKNSWDLIRTLSQISSLPWCIVGDFNDLLHQSDKQGNSRHPQSLIDGFRMAIDDCNLTEIDLQGGMFTWERGRGTKDWVREKLDWAFASRSWWNKYPLCKLVLYHTTYSDHDPILLDLLSTTFSKKQFRFKFENTWLEEPSFRKEVADFWLTLPRINILPKLIFVSSFMARWGRNFFHKFRDKIKKQKATISNLVDRTDDVGIAKYFEEKNKLDDLLFQEEVY
ncbi:uncharacterized protein LOC141707310 [Apium graveolens]|uniref:uncharacterized protein LOC141707310 n=1 Tax=Apium graveolens TaxID=4045 RepID=UPI003D79680F